MTSEQPLAAPLAAPNTVPVAPKSPNIKLKKAVQRLVRGPDGTVQLIYIDLETLQQITDLTGYRIINSDNTIVEETEDPTDPESPVVDAKPAEPGEEIKPIDRSGDHQKSVSMYDQARGFPAAPSPYRAPNSPTEGTTTAAPSNPYAVTKPGSTSVSPVRDARNVPAVGSESLSPTRDSQNIPALADSAPTAQVRDAQDVGSVKTRQGSVLPALDQERFSPPVRDVSNIPEARVKDDIVSSPRATNVSPVGLISRPTSPVPGVPSGIPGYNESYGPKRPNRPAESFIDSITKTAQEVSPGSTVVGISGQGEYGSHRHRDKRGVAADFDVYDGQGQKLSDEQMKDLASKYAYSNPTAGIGYGPGYMAPQRIHLDLADDPAQWGNENTIANMDSALNQTIDAARRGYQPTPFANAPTPTERPTAPKPSTSATGVGGMFDQGERQKTPGSIFDRIGPTENNTPSVSTDMKDRKIADATPAEAANMGAISRSPAEISRIARAVAGELDPSTMDGLAAGDETATKEFANVMASVENRAGSKKFSSLDKTLVGKQYNSLLSENEDNTNSLYSKYGTTLESKVAEYYAGSIKPTNYAVTNYLNKEVTEDKRGKLPSWSKKMTDQEQVGFHTFGNLTGVESSYGPSQSFKDSRAKMGYSGESTWGNRQDSPSESRRGSTSSREAAGRGIASNHSSEHERDNSLSRSDSSRSNRTDTSRSGSRESSKSSSGNKSNKTDTSRSGSRESSKSSAGRESNSSRGGVGAGRSNNGGHRAE